VANKKGNIFIYDISPCPPNILHSVAYGDKGPIRALCFNERLNYLFSTNNMNGLISIFDVGKPGREKFAKNVANYPA